MKEQMRREIRGGRGQRRREGGGEQRFMCGERCRETARPIIDGTLLGEQGLESSRHFQRISPPFKAPRRNKVALLSLRGHSMRVTLLRKRKSETKLAAVSFQRSADIKYESSKSMKVFHFL